MCYIPDNYDRWAEHDARQEAELRKLPTCDYCGETVMDEYYFDINDEILCVDCLCEHYRKSVDDYIE